jgi:hypothetical protein
MFDRILGTIILGMVSGSCHPTFSSTRCLHIDLTISFFCWITYRKYNIFIFWLDG